MKSFIIFITCSLSFVTCEAVFGQRISALKNSTLKEPTKSAKDLKSHESFRTYEWALPPIEVQTRYPKVVAEEHTLHELPPLKPALPMDEPVIFADSLPDFGPHPPKQTLYTPKHVPIHYEHDLPVYRDDPKEHLKGLVPVHRESTEHLPLIKPINSLPLYNHVAQQDSGHFGYIEGIPGIPWKDYPIFHSIPYTNFKCGYTKYPGYYADVEAGCQVWHFCQLDGKHDRFLCANGTLFNQKTRVCDWWYNVDCQSSISKYDINSDLYRVPHKNYIPVVNPVNHHDLELPLNRFHIPLEYQREIDPSSGPLIYSESQSVPKKIIKRVRKVRVNNTLTDSNSLNNRKNG